MNVTHAFRSAKNGKMIRIIQEDENGFIGQFQDFENDSWHHEFSFGPLSEEKDICERYGFDSLSSFKSQKLSEDNPAYCFYQPGMVFEIVRTRQRFVVSKTVFNGGFWKVVIRLNDQWYAFRQEDIRFVSIEKHDFRYCF